MYLYTRYERFWHWLQMLLIVTLLVTGLEVHGSYTLLGFESAVEIHNTAGITWLIAFSFFVFWIFTTGEWRQYVPTTRKMLQVVRYYSYGIFRGESHPVPKRKEAKHNPLQRLVYLSLAAFLLPVQMVSGLLYWGYNEWPAWGIAGWSLSPVVFCPYRRCICHLLLHYRPCLYDHHRPYRHGPRPGNDPPGGKR